MSKIGFVIPTYNRSQNLALVLRALSVQAGVTKELQVVVADDGSLDYGATSNTVKGFSGLAVRYLWRPHDGYGVSWMRNRGARLLDPDTTHVWFVDSDVLLNPGALAHGYELVDKYPQGVVICGKYDWLPPMVITADDVVHHWDKLVGAALPPKQVDYTPNLLGNDPRFSGRPELWNCSALVEQFRGGTLSGNLIVPMALMNETGGFDEAIKGQGQDCEFGYHLQAAGARAVFCSHIIGYHVSHEMDIKWKTASVRETIRYIHKKYGIPLDEEKLPQ